MDSLHIDSTPVRNVQKGTKYYLTISLFNPVKGTEVRVESSDMSQYSKGFDTEYSALQECRTIAVQGFRADMGKGFVFIPPHRILSIEVEHR